MTGSLVSQSLLHHCTLQSGGRTVSSQQTLNGSLCDLTMRGISWWFRVTCFKVCGVWARIRVEACKPLPWAPAVGSDTSALTGDPLLSLKLLEIFVTWGKLLWYCLRNQFHSVHLSYKQKRLKEISVTRSSGISQDAQVERTMALSIWGGNLTHGDFTRWKRPLQASVLFAPVLLQHVLH